jgi:hypothetical protein
MYDKQGNVQGYRPIVGSSYLSQNPEHLLPRLESIESRSLSQHAHFTNGNQTFREDTAINQATLRYAHPVNLFKRCAGRLNRK